jgi:NhaA family Na+:H+ antiporter
VSETVEDPQKQPAPAIDFLFENSLFLVFGAVFALVWANVSYESYEHLAHGKLFHFAVNDIGMAFFFAIAAKEVWEAMLPGGQLSSIRTATTPLIATAGGMVGPAALFIGGCILLGQPTELASRGWAVPVTTDIAFSYLVARMIFGAKHPAIPFLLLLAIADDAAGLIILAVKYPQAPLNLPVFFGLVTLAVVMGLVMSKKFRIQSFWAYMIPGVISWVGFWQGGLHPALGLVPIIPTMPHAAQDLGIFATEEHDLHDTLNEFEHWWERPVEIILGFFGFVNAGVLFASLGPATWLVLLGLVIGKPLGITLFVVVIAGWILRFRLPAGMDVRDLFVVGCIAGIGFTVSLFVATAAFPKNQGPEVFALLDPVKMGALLSFGAAAVSFAAAKVLGVKKWSPERAAEVAAAVYAEKAAAE